MKSYYCIPAVIAALAVGLPLSASAQITDAAGDFLTTYTGPKNGDLDVLTSNVAYTPGGFIFTATMNGAIGTTPNGLYVWGLDRGQGTARFGALANGVLFDSVVTVTPTGVAAARDLISGSALTTGINVIISGNSLEADVPLSALPSLGLRQNQFTWNLWPRLSGGGTENISDFAPDNSNVRVTAAVPEPGSVALCAALFAAGGAGLLRRRSRKNGA